jgi:cardiolipin synthase
VFDTMSFAAIFNRRQIPNWICVFRVVLIAPILVLLARSEFQFALLLIAIAAFSDALDGYLAKRFDWGSRLGGFLDPLADKFLLVAIFLVLTGSGLIPVWLTAVVIGRDLAIVIGGFTYQWLIGEVYADPTWISKVNTFLQLMFVLCVVAQEGFGLPGELILLMLGTSVFVSSLITGLDYIWTWGGRALANRGQERT